MSIYIVPEKGEVFGVSEEIKIFLRSFRQLADQTRTSRKISFFKKIRADNVLWKTK
jgi:hypothetical protein